jgi:hypothetical protein
MATYPDGTLLKASGPEVDRMVGGQRRWIPDPPTFNCMGLNWGAIQTIADTEWNQIPKGAPYPSRADNALVQGSGPQVYVMTGCQRHWIPDPDTFNAHGYNWSAIQHVSDVDLTAIPEGAPLQQMQWLAPLQQQHAMVSQKIADVIQQMMQRAQQLQQSQLTADQAKQLVDEQQQAMLTLQQAVSEQQQAVETMTNTMKQMSEVQENVIRNI